MESPLTDRAVIAVIAFIDVYPYAFIDVYPYYPSGIQETPSGKMRRIRDFKFFTEFQSHEAEFDYLKSLDIKRKINAIKWYPKNNDALFVLSTNGEHGEQRLSCLLFTRTGTFIYQLR